jgi:hypothetical protein
MVSRILDPGPWEDPDPVDVWPNSISEWLEAAADIIEQRGWTQGAFRSDHNERCLVGALKDTAPDQELRDMSPGLAEFRLGLDTETPLLEPLKYVFDELDIEEDWDGMSDPDYDKFPVAATMFNDEIAKSADEVIDVLRWAAKRARDLEEYQQG